jgi:large exoprotein involved in heme utilization and adhesion
MADGEKFSANLSQQSVLTSAPPAAFGFLSSNPAPIAIQGSSLQVPEGKTLSVVGGDLQITGGSLSAPHGQLNLASVASAGEVIPTVSEQGPDLKLEGFGRLGKIEASQGAHINTDGEGGGSVVIRGGQLVVDNAIISSNTQGNADGARVGIDAQIAEDVVIANAGRIESTVTGSGNGGSTELKVGQVTLTDGARIDTSTHGGGRGGALSVTATDSVSISGRDSKGAKSGLFSNALGRGDGGKVSVSAPTLTMSDRGAIDAHTAGDGNAGNIEAQVGTLTLTGGAQIQARSGVAEFKEGVLTHSGTGGPGRGGDVTVRATDSITISGRDSDGNYSGLGNGTVNKGDAGRLSISTPLLQIDGGRISAGTLGDGNAGNIDVQVGQLTLTGGAIISTSVGVRQFTDSSFPLISTGGPGRGGELTVHASEAISLFGGSVLAAITGGKGDVGKLSVSTPMLLIDGGIFVGGIFAFTVAEGNAGDIDVQVGRLTLQHGGQIFTGTGALVPDGKGGFTFIGADDTGHGGNLTVHATEAIMISGQNSLGQSSGLFTDALKGSGNGGQLFISAPVLELSGGRIESITLSEGNGGDINVQVGKLILQNGGQIANPVGGVVPDGKGGFIIIGADNSGHGGNITVKATESISISGQNGPYPSVIATSTQKGRGASGQLFVSTPVLDLRDGGGIASDSLRESTGNAGDIRLEVGKLTMSGDAFIHSGTIDQGQGGNIQIQARQIELTNDQAAIAANSSGAGNAGNIAIHVDDTFRSRNSTVSTSSLHSGGGKIDLSAGQIVELVDSQVTTTVQGGAGDAGNITIDPRYVILNNSQVIARAVEGNGGNINIGADVFLASPTSVVDASSQKGISGTIDIRGAVSNLSGLITPLPQGYLSTAILSEDRCAGRLREGQVSSFVVTGREGMPLQPGGVLPSPLYEAGQVRTQGGPATNNDRHVVWQVPRVTPVTLDGGCGR